jgi:hypothetical protein
MLSDSGGGKCGLQRPSSDRGITPRPRTGIHCCSTMRPAHHRSCPLHDRHAKQVPARVLLETFRSRPDAAGVPTRKALTTRLGNRVELTFGLRGAPVSGGPSQELAKRAKLVPGRGPASPPSAGRAGATRATQKQPTWLVPIAESARRDLNSNQKTFEFCLRFLGVLSRSKAEAGFRQNV